MDWNRSKGIYDEHAYQVAAYAVAIQALTGEDVLTAYVVRLHQGAWRRTPVPMPSSLYPCCPRDTHNDLVGCASVSIQKRGCG